MKLVEKLVVFDIPAIESLDLSYIDQIRALNYKYLINHLAGSQKQEGFIRIEYTKADLERIIAEKEIVIATDNDKVIGYYLIGRESRKPELDYQKAKAESLFETHKIQFSEVGYGCQVCIEKEFRNSGLFRQLLLALSESVKFKYTHLLCSVSDANIASMKTHLNNKWELLGKSETKNYLIYKTGQQQLVK